MSDASRSFVSVSVTISTWRARAWVRLIGFLVPVIGVERAERWAEAGAWRLCRYRVGTGRWQRFSDVPRPAVEAA